MDDDDDDDGDCDDNADANGFVNLQPSLGGKPSPVEDTPPPST